MQTIIGKEYPVVAIEEIKNAKKSIDILVYEWRWYEDQIGSNIQKFNSQIIYAARRGVTIRAITRTRDTVAKLVQNGAHAKMWTGGNTMHTKMMLIDNKVLFIGSHNFTMNGFNLNLEVSTMQKDEAGFADILNHFNSLWSL